MRNVKINISELGPIRDSEIELKPMMIYTGNSGLGKSYTSFVTYYFQKSISLQGRLQLFIENRMNNIEGGTENTFSFQLKDFRQWLNNGVSQYVGSLLGYDDFKCNVVFIFDMDDDMTINVKIAEDTDRNLRHIILNDEDYYFPKTYGNIQYNVTEAFSKFLCKEFYGTESKIPLLFPPARAAFATSGIGDTSPIGMYSEFINGLNVLKLLTSQNVTDEQLLNSMVKNFIGGELMRKEGQMYIQIEGQNSPIPVSAAASSIKELLPLFLLLKNRLLHGVFQVLFEEPEAHVHPLKQHIVADMIARCFNNGTMFQITTHSDYLLSRINQLIRVGNVKKASDSLYEKFCTENNFNRNLYIDAEKIGAYYFSKNGEGKVDIIPLETTNGIDFKTFEEIVNKQLKDDAAIEDYENVLTETE